MERFNNFISEDYGWRPLMEASGGIKPEDLWKRDNLQRFIDKSVAGELINSSGDKIPAIPSNNELIKLLKTLDDEPEGEVLTNFKKLFSKNIGPFSKVPKAENGFSTSKAGTPSGAQWEALIAIAVNKIKNKTWNEGPEWDDVGKFWAEYEGPSMKLGKDFINKIGVSELKQLGGSTAKTNPDWKGIDKTPKTDILGGTKKISLKKASGSQLMSAGQAEAISTFEAAMSMYSIDSSGKKQVESVISAIENDMGRMSTKGTIGSVEKLRDSGKTLSPEDKSKIEEMEGLQLNAKTITTKLENLFKDDKFKSYFCWEAATGDVKFKPSPDAIANVIVKFKESGSIKDFLVLDSPDGAGKTLAKGNNFFVSFKTAGEKSKPYLALRSKNVKAIKNDINEQITFNQIIREELEKENIGIQILNESSLQQLDEFALWNKLKSKAKGFSSKVVNAAKRIYQAVMKRISEAFNYIKTLGEKMIHGLMNFMGVSIRRVKVSGGGKWSL